MLLPIQVITAHHKGNFHSWAVILFYQAREVRQERKRSATGPVLDGYSAYKREDTSAVTPALTRAQRHGMEISSVNARVMQEDKKEKENRIYGG